MRWIASAVASEDGPSPRLARWTPFLATLTLIAILGLAKSAEAQAVPADGGLVAAALPAPLFEEESEEEAEASEDEEFEVEACEEDEAEECMEDESGPEAPQECLLSSVRATVFAVANRDKVRLQVNYTTTSPTTVAITYGLHGSKGSLFLGGEKKQLGRKGVLRLNRSLTETQMAKVVAAKGFTVRLRIAAAPRYCQALFDRQLNVRRATPSGLLWQQSE